MLFKLIWVVCEFAKEIVLTKIKERLLADILEDKDPDYLR